MLGDIFRKLIGKQENSNVIDSQKEPSIIQLPYKPRGIRTLFIADTHGHITTEERQLVRQGKEAYDMIVFLGDHGGELHTICGDISEGISVYGILGNHDGFGMYDHVPKSLHQPIYIGNSVYYLNENLKIAAVDGSIRYKGNPDYCMYTQEQYKDIIGKLSKADICISHGRPSQGEEKREYPDAHEGIDALQVYLEKYSIPLHIHGHMHDPGERILKNGTRSICVYRMQVIEI